MKKLFKILGVVLLVFAVIVVFVIVKDVINNNKTNNPPITNNGGNQGNNNGNNGDDDPSKNPEEPVKEVYTTYEPADELVKLFNVVKVDGICLEGKQNDSEYCQDTDVSVNIYWFGGGNAVKEAMVENLNMIINHPEFETLNKIKKIRANIDITYNKPLHGNLTYCFEFLVLGHSGETQAEVSFSGRIASSKEEVMIKQEDIDSVYNLYHKYYS